jgi:3-oxoacyl-[acyl-carrier-protein] synthase-3
MSGVKVIGTGYSLPVKVVTNDDLSKVVDTNDEWIYSRTGIKSRHIISGDEAVHTLAVSSAEKAIKNAYENDSDFSKDKIIAVYVATMTSSYVFPSTACIVQKELELPESIKAFDISAACTGFVYALQTAADTLQTHGGDEGYVLVIGSECMSRTLNFSDRSSCVLFGDGAGSVIIKKDDSESSVFMQLSGTEGNTEVLHCGTYNGGDGYLHMDGGKVYKFAITSLNGAIKKLLENSGSTMEDIDYVVCHQANSRIIDSVKKKYPGHEHKFFMNMETCANTSAASVSIAMADMYEKGLLKSGMKIITVAFGAGLSWNAVLMTV